MIQAAVQGLKQKFAIDHATLQVETIASAEICALRPAHVV